jgi:copper transport protein
VKADRSNDTPRLLGRAPVLLAALAAAALFGLGPRPAFAHATVLSSQPEPGQRLQNTPGVVVLGFSERLNTQLSTASVTAPSGQRFGPSSISPTEIRVGVDSNTPGLYQVTWTTVSAVDGHTLRGGFQFGVRVSPSGQEQQNQALPLPPDLLIAVARGLEYAGLLGALGMLLLLELARRSGTGKWVRPPLRAALGLALVSGIAVVLGEALAAAGGAPALVSTYLLGGPPGWARLARLAAELAALAVALQWPRLAAVPLLVTFAALATAGHAAAAEPAGPAIVTDAGHLVFAGLWAGGILALATLRPPRGWLGPEARKLLSRFTPVALVAFPLTIGTGLLRALSEVGSVQALLSTAYGLVLGVKVLAILALLPLSLLAWRRLLPAPRLEAAFVVGVVAATALLAAFPLPPASLAEAEAARAGPQSALALPAAGDLTLGSDTGSTLVALTLRPGRPGMNQAWLYVLPLEGETAANHADVTVRLAGRVYPTRRCGPTCRTVNLRLQGGDSLSVDVSGAGGGTAPFTLPSLPAPDGRALFDRLQARMHALSGYALDETLEPAKEPLRTAYAFQAPNRMRFEVSTGYQAVYIGTTKYSRDSSQARWQVERAPAVTVPEFVWDGAGIVAPRLLTPPGADRGQNQVLSFFEMFGEIPTWFQLSVDSQGLVNGVAMRAQGHFMEHHYFDFDSPPPILPPLGAG